MSKYSLKGARDRVALEAFVVSDVAGLIRRIFPTIAGGLDGFKGAFGPNTAVGITSKQRDFLKLLETQRYTTTMGMTATVPEGLRATYMEYAQALWLAVDHLTKMPAVLDQYATFLALLVSDRNAPAETINRARVFQEMTAGRDAASQAIVSCFDKGSTRAQVKVENVIKRNGDWSELFKTLDLLSTTINKIERKHLTKKIDECEGYLQRIGQKINEGAFEHASPEMIMNLSDNAYQVASELEFYALVYYRVELLCKAVDETVKKIQTTYSTNPKDHPVPAAA